MRPCSAFIDVDTIPKMEPAAFEFDSFSHLESYRIVKALSQGVQILRRKGQKTRERFRGRPEPRQKRGFLVLLSASDRGLQPNLPQQRKQTGAVRPLPNTQVE